MRCQFLCSLRFRVLIELCRIEIRKPIKALPRVPNVLIELCRIEISYIWRSSIAPGGLIELCRIEMLLSWMILLGFRLRFNRTL